MMSLYFNCRITEQQLTPDKLNSVWFYPITFPRSIDNARLSQFEVLLKTIESYSKIEFDVAVFNIEIDNINDENKKEIEKIIEKYKTNKIIINYKRPSTINEWIKNVTEIKKHIKANTPVLVCMNHDHPFVDYTTKVFSEIVEKIFNEKENNYGKALYYSHAPEVISWGVNGHGSIKFTKNNDGIFISGINDNWLDCICLMTLETLKKIWSQAKYNGDYIGRFDWNGVSFSNLGINIYMFPREFFKHYDGYGHVTGIRLISEINFESNNEFNFYENNNINDQVKFYYQRWLDCYIVLIRDKLRSKNVFKESERVRFINAIEETIDLFKCAYLEADLKANILSENKLKLIQSKLKSHVYYNGNMIYDVIKTDIKLNNEIRKNEIIENIKSYIPTSLKNSIKKIINKWKIKND